MSSGQLSHNRISLRYALALYHSVVASGDVADTEKELITLLRLIADCPEFKNAIVSPVLKLEQQRTLIDFISEKLNLRSKASSIMKVLSDNSRLYLLEEVIVKYFEVKAKAEKRVTAKVQSAEALSASQKEILARNLALQSGLNVELDVEVNKELIGGIKVIMGSLLLDGSVSRKLEMLRENLKNSKTVISKEVV